MPDPAWSATHGLVLADPMSVPMIAPSLTEWYGAWGSAFRSAGLMLWDVRGFVLIGAGLVLLLAVGLSLWDRRGTGS